MGKLPNIVIFNPDQFRADRLGHLGDKSAVTPNMDRISREDGVSFSHAFCQNPVCTPSRCSFMSGWYPHVRGHRMMHHMMRPGEPVLLKTLKDLGYYVWWGGKNDLVQTDKIDDYCNFKARYSGSAYSDTNQMRGSKDGDNYYSFYFGCVDNPRNSDWYYVNEAEKFINSKHNSPFCIYLPLEFPHPPYEVEEPYFSMIDRTKLPKRIKTPNEFKDKPSILRGIYKLQNMQNWNEERFDELRAVYGGMCTRIDAQLGMLVNALKKKGIYEDTAIFILSDHGDFTGDYGLVEKTQNTFEDCLTRVPFIIKPPANIKVSPGICDSLVELLDFPATVMDMLGQSFGYSQFGESLLPLIEGKTTKHREYVFCEGGRLSGEEHCKEKESLAGEDSLYWPRICQQYGDGPEHTKAVMIRSKQYKYVYRLYEKDELYDMEKDPGETANLIDDKNFCDILKILREKLLEFYVRTCDVVPFDLDKRW